MKCPLCSIDLVMSERQGVEIDYCPQCRGVWLDRGELDKIIEKSSQPQQSTVPSHSENHSEYRGGHDEHEHKKYKRKSFLHELFD
jgi:Zn-finger nucleic acid-binding protein